MPDDTSSFCQVTPLPDHQVSFRLAGRERLRWHFGPSYPRPFFFPLIGPAGESLTRMGHPGAPNHDHHRSVWFAHEKVGQENFWSDPRPGQVGARIQQSHWLVYDEGPEQGLMAVQLEWMDRHDKKLLDQELIVAVKPAPENGLLVDMQSTLGVTESERTLGQSSFGVLAVRVSKSLSGHFGGGVISNSEGQVGEGNCFGQSARWMDYSGPIRLGGRQPIEGITYFDHPSNPSYPTHWHVREDGWMGASVTRHQSIRLTPDKPLVLRYLLHVHPGRNSPSLTEALADAFGRSPAATVARSSAAHRQYEIQPAAASSSADRR